jgi:rRNA processing protein Gar1
MLVFKQVNHDKVPKFNAPLFSANKQKIATIDEIFGPINEVVLWWNFTVLIS